MPNSTREIAMLQALVDYFIHSDLRASTDQYYRGRILIAVMLSLAAVPLLALMAVLITGMYQTSILFGSTICISTALIFMGLLWLAKTRGEFLICSVATVLTMLAAITTGIVVSGGPSISPAVFLLVIPPLSAYFFGGLRWGAYTVAATFSVLLLLFISYLLSIPFIQTLGDEGQIQTARMIITLMNCSVVSGMAMIYEYTSNALKRERDEEHLKVMHLAKIDPLTGLSNRRNFDATLDERIELYGAQNPPRQFALGIIDLDGFKPINDHYGHGVGDEVLCKISDRLHAALRGSDFVGRHGGDEFMLLLDLPHGVSTLEAMAQRLLTSIASPIETSAGNVGVSGSLGFAIFPFDATDSEELKKAADIAMYEAKEQRGNWRLYKQPTQPTQP